MGELVDRPPAQPPRPTVLRGRHVLLRPLRPTEDAEALYADSHPPAAPDGLWTYLFTGPYGDVAALQGDLEEMARSEDRLFFTLARLQDERPAGIASYLRITPDHAVIEIGNILFGVSLQRTTAATEAIYLMAAHAFDELGYRRLEWKCNALNAPSRRAADRLGFRFEGVFRHHMIVKGRNRDTAWYAITDEEWPAVKAGLQAWLAEANFDAQGRQRVSLAALMAPRQRG